MLRIIVIVIRIITNKVCKYIIKKIIQSFFNTYIKVTNNSIIIININNKIIKKYLTKNFKIFSKIFFIKACNKIIIIGLKSITRQNKNRKNVYKVFFYENNKIKKFILCKIFIIKIKLILTNKDFFINYFR